MPTTNYTFANLFGDQGEGTSSIDLTLGTPYTFTISNNSGSSYFTMESRTTNPNLSGSFTALNNISGVSSLYIAGFVLPVGVSSFIFTPSTNVSGSDLQLRGVGGISLALSY
jgi:hypothetical protein